MLLQGLPERSEFKKVAERDGGWSQFERIVASLRNEIALLRAGYHAVHGGEDAAYEPYLFEDPLVEIERDRKAREDNEFQKQAEADLYADFGFS